MSELLWNFMTLWDISIFLFVWVKLVFESSLHIPSSEYDLHILAFKPKLSFDQIWIISAIFSSLYYFILQKVFFFLKRTTLLKSKYNNKINNLHFLCVYHCSIISALAIIKLLYLRSLGWEHKWNQESNLVELKDFSIR